MMDMSIFEQIFGSSVPQTKPDEVRKEISKSPKPIILDVRQPYEYQSGHIQGAKLIPLGELPAKMNQLPRNQEIICVCQSGSRSSSAARHLQSAGYNVRNMQGGMDMWQRSGLPVSKG
jgi:rhodanese-related sulfurtransferase